MPYLCDDAALAGGKLCSVAGPLHYPLELISLSSAAGAAWFRWVWPALSLQD